MVSNMWAIMHKYAQNVRESDSTARVSLNRVALIVDVPASSLVSILSFELKHRKLVIS